MKRKSTAERRDGVERRKVPGRRAEDPAVVEETTWQEACSHDRKVIHLLQEGYEHFTKMTLIALIVLALFVGFSLWQDFSLGSENSDRIHDIHNSRLIDAEQRCLQQRKANSDLVKFLYEVTPPRRRVPHFVSQVQGFADAIDPRHKDCVAYAREVVNTTVPPHDSGIILKEKRNR